MRRPRAGSAPDDGLGLVEILVSLMLLAILTLAVAPLLIQGLTQSSRMRASDTANQRLEVQLEAIRSTPPTCGSTETVGPVASVTDPQGVRLETIQRIGACPATRPGTVRIDVTVRRTDTGASLSTASTFLYVS